MALNDIWQITDIQNVHGTRLTNVSHWRQDNSGDAALSFDAISRGYRFNVSPGMVAQLGADWTSVCREFRIVGVTGQAFLKDATAVGPGTAVGETLNPATVAVIAKFTSTGSLRGTGAMYISGIVAPYEQRNNLTTEGLAAMDAVGALFVTPFVDQGITFVPVRAAGSKKDPLSTPENPLPDITWPAEPWVLSDERVRLTKLQSRRMSTRC